MSLFALAKLKQIADRRHTEPWPLPWTASAGRATQVKAVRLPGSRSKFHQVPMFEKVTHQETRLDWHGLSMFKDLEKILSMFKHVSISVSDSMIGISRACLAKDPMRFTQLEPGQFEAGAVKWDIVGGDTFRSKIKQEGHREGQHRCSWMVHVYSKCLL